MTQLQKELPAYRNAGLGPEKRAQDLLARMTVAEKLAQLGSRWAFELFDGDRFSPSRAHELIPDGIGQVTRLSGATALSAESAAAAANEIQTYLISETRLGIPAIVHEEICSGLMAAGTVVFPQALGLASTWDPALAEAVADTIRSHMRARGAHQGLGPVLDVARDPRWGRIEETFGEDTQLVASMGTAFISGLQARDPTQGVVATAKHLFGYGASEGGLNWAPVALGAREAREIYLYPFEAAVAAGVGSVMPAYVDVDGVPCMASRWILTEILREEWGFDGIVVSDYFGVRQLVDHHRFAPDAAAAAAQALDAGVDVELPTTDCYGTPLRQALAAHLVDEAAIDRAVLRALSTKFRLGLFDEPLVEPAAASRASNARSESELARTVARASIVLLRNTGILPLDPELTCAVIGPNARSVRNLYGDYAYPAHIESLQEARTGDKNVFGIPVPDTVGSTNAEPSAPTVFDALRDRLGPDRVHHAAGCEVTGGSRDGFDEAVALAAYADVAILVLGDKSGLTDDCTSGESRDRTSLDLPGMQEELARAVIATGTPTVLVIVGGRPQGSEWIHKHCSAALMAWLPGDEGANAIAEILTGNISPSGKLPLSYPRNVGQIPVFYAHKASGGRSHWKGDYADSPATPLYPFGHGLSYTQFEISKSELDLSGLNNGTVIVTASIRNRGDRTGAETLQLYTRTLMATVNRPVLELRAFLRSELTPGQSSDVAFELPVALLGYYDREMSYVVEPCDIEVHLGTSSQDVERIGSFSIPAHLAGPVTSKAFAGAARATGS